MQLQQKLLTQPLTTADTMLPASCSLPSQYVLLGSITPATTTTSISRTAAVNSEATAATTQLMMLPVQAVS